ncbi:MAG: septum formation initiator family protein [Acidobacteria bacterium]|nr:septum formation initiator family protein [Acidobacteriota bacterium]MDA1234300.1 septum formation initiator family protein [Acidobacteriota bacterium]
MTVPDSIWLVRKRIGYICAIGLAVAWLQASGMQAVLDLREAWMEESRLSEQIQELEQHNAELEADIKALESNGFRVEQLAREKLGLARENEVVVVVPGKK